MTAKLSRTVRCAAAVLAAIAIGAGASACDPGNSSDNSQGSSSGASQDSSSRQQGDNAKDGDAAPGGGAGKTVENGSRTDAVNEAPAAASQNGERCHTAEMSYHVGGPHGGHPDMETDEQQVETIKLTNDADHTCTMYGFPGIQLVSKDGRTWDLPRSSSKPSTITLEPGEDTAMISINLLPLPSAMKGPKGFEVKDILVTPPNETTHVTLEWAAGGEILDQSGATHSGTFVEPVGIG